MARARPTDRRSRCDFALSMDKAAGDKNFAKSTLQDDVLAAFERACHEQDFEVADDLLHALETFNRREAADELLQQAFRVFSRLVSTGHKF